MPARGRGAARLGLLGLALLLGMAGAAPAEQKTDQKAKQKAGHKTHNTSSAFKVPSGSAARTAYRAQATHSAHKTRQTVTGHQVVMYADAPASPPLTQVRSLYQLHCAGCHGATGQGLYGAHVPDLRPMGRFLSLPGGREFLMRVPGVMGSGLDDAQVAAVLNWMMHSLADPMPDDNPFTAAEIGRARAQPLVDVMQERRRLMQLATKSGLTLAPLGSP